jgi:hypothetical protein
MAKKFKKSGIAPLVQPDRLELGDTRLDPEETVVREREDLLRIAAKSRIWGQDEQEDAGRSCGPRMPSGTLISRILKLNPNIKFVDGIEGNVAIYRPLLRNEVDPEAADTRPDRKRMFDDFKYIGGFPLGQLVEWGHILTDTSRLGTREIRGWRSVLIALIKNRAITYHQAVMEFGEPGDRRSWMWHQQLRSYR